MLYTRTVIACLYDVHGNLPALEAVLADFGEADRYILGRRLRAVRRLGGERGTPAGRLPSLPTPP
jgi:hypothetical protein